MKNNKGVTNKATIIVIIVVAAIAAVALKFMLGGSGNNQVGSTIFINNKADMALLQDSKNWNKDFVLNSDIDMTNYTNWTPVGTATNPFSGTFDGKGHKISNLNINRPNQSNVGLFAYIGGATNGKKGKVTNVTFINAQIYGGETSGIVAAICEGSISNVNIDGTVDCREYDSIGGACGIFNGNAENILCRVSVGGRRYVGGFAGYVQGGNIKNVYVGLGSSITGENSSVGGLLGRTLNFDKLTVSECYTKGNVSAVESKAGGLIGELQSRSDDPNKNTIITDCYSTCDIDKCKTGSAGGFIGELASTGAEAVKINNCYSAGYIDKQAVNRGGFIGKMEAGSSTLFVNDFWINLYTDNSDIPGVGGEIHKEQYVTELEYDFSTNDLTNWNDGKWKIESSGAPKVRITLNSEPSSSKWQF